MEDSKLKYDDFDGLLKVIERADMLQSTKIAESSIINLIQKMAEEKILLNSVATKMYGVMSCLMDKMRELELKIDRMEHTIQMEDSDLGDY